MSMVFESVVQNHKSGQLWSEEHERYVIDVLKSDKNITKNRQFYHIKSTFKLVSLAGLTKVARIKDNRLMATKSNVFSIIHNLHTACGHKGEKKTYKKVCEYYANIPMSLIKRFIEQCAKCTGRNKKKSQVGTDVGPITINDLNQRCQIEIVDFQSLPDGQYTFILHYKENIAKFNLLRPLTSKRAFDVAKELLNIFLDFGAPHVLESDHSREYTAEVIKELANLWPDLILINGRPSNPHIQDPVERHNCPLTDSLITWMRENNTSSWSEGLRFVQWRMNTTHNEAIKMEPYVAVFGQKAKMGLKSKIPTELSVKITNGLFEEEMEQLIYDDCCDIVTDTVSDVLLNDVHSYQSDSNDYDINNNKDYPVIQTIEVIGVDVLTSVHTNTDHMTDIEYNDSILHDEILLIKGNLQDT